MPYIITVLGEASAILFTQCQRTAQESAHIYSKFFQIKVNGFYLFYVLLLQRDISSMWQSSWICLWAVTSLFCSMSRVAVADAC